MLQVKSHSFWFVVGSQHLYGKDVLREVKANAIVMAEQLNDEGKLSYKIELKKIVTSQSEISQLILEANSDPHCAGLITWMHTFSPGKMWIAGLASLQKPLLHLHTQFNRDIPWETIDMDYMNLNQSAHGDREYAYMVTRLNIPRKVVVGYWKHADVQERINNWMKTAVAVQESRHLRIARFGDNMRSVASTEGDKIEAQIKLGWTVDYIGIGDVVERIEAVTKDQVDSLFDEYQRLYKIDNESLIDFDFQSAIKEQARIELGLRDFLESEAYTAFTTNFEDLHGLNQLPGLAVQRLMAEGYGFAGEGDWKTAAMTRLLKVLSNNQNTSFMEDYTYHLEPGNEMILGSHMLEVCPTIAAGKPEIIVHPLDIGGKQDPARLVFDGKAGSGTVSSLIHLSGRYRLVINDITSLMSANEVPNLPVAKALWKPHPSLTTAAEAWIYAGGSHHTVFSLAVTKEQLYDFADILQIECLIIDENTNLNQFRQELKINEVIWKK